MNHAAPRRDDDSAALQHHQPRQRSDRGGGGGESNRRPTAVRAFCCIPGDAASASRRLVEVIQRYPSVALHEELTALRCHYASARVTASCGDGITTEADALPEAEQTVLLPQTTGVPRQGTILVTKASSDLFAAYFGGEGDTTGGSGGSAGPLPDDSEGDVSSGDEGSGARAGPAKRSRSGAGGDGVAPDPASAAALAFQELCTSKPRTRNRHDPIDCVSLVIPVCAPSYYEKDEVNSLGHGESFALTLREVLDPDFIRETQGGLVGYDELLRRENIRQTKLDGLREVTRLRRGTVASDVVDLVGQHVLPGRRLTRAEAATFDSPAFAEDCEAAQRLMSSLAEDILGSLFHDMTDAQQQTTTASSSSSSYLGSGSLFGSVLPFVSLSYVRSSPVDASNAKPYKTHVLMLNAELPLPRGLPTHIFVGGPTDRSASPLFRKPPRVFLVELTPISEKVKLLRVAGYHLCPRPQFEAALAVESLREVYRQAIVRKLVHASAHGVRMKRLAAEYDRLIKEAEVECERACRHFLRAEDKEDATRVCIEGLMGMVTVDRFAPLFPTSAMQETRMNAVTFKDMLAPPLVRGHPAMLLPSAGAGGGAAALPSYSDAAAGFYDVDLDLDDSAAAAPGAPEAGLGDCIADLQHCIVALRKHYGFRRYPIPLQLLEQLMCALGLSVFKAREVVNLVLECVDQALVGLE